MRPRARSGRRLVPATSGLDDQDMPRSGGDTSGPSTTSGWSHPERWQGADAEEARPGMILKERFLLREEVGRGGMGVVFRALDQRKEEAQDRDPFVAIKVLNEEFKRRPESLKSLQREARRSQSLAHPNVVNVFDFDRDGATVFMTMELLDGQPLNRLLRDNLDHRLPPAQALPIIQGMAEALAYAHKNGVIHSDFKPGNVFLTKNGVVKVFDFGIAQAVRRLHGQRAGDQTLFDARTLGALTPSYASLEMLAGDEPDPRDDLYALGCVAYELLAGRHPFNKMPADEAFKKKLKPPPIHGLSRRRQRTLEHALAFKRADRSPSVESFLLEFIKKQPVRWPLALAAVLVLAVVGGIGAFFIAPNYVSQSKIKDLISELQSGEPREIDRALKKLKTLNADSRIVVVHQVQTELMAYFKARIANATDNRQGHFDFPEAEALLAQFRYLYPEHSAELDALGRQIADRRDRLLDQYTLQLNESLVEGHWLASNGQPGVAQVLDTITRIDPNSPLLHDARLASAFARAAERALDASGYERGAAIADAGLQHFPDNAALISARDEASNGSARLDRPTLVSQLRAHVQQALPGLKSLADFRPLRADAARLAALAPTDPVVSQFRSRLRPVLEAVLTKATSAHDWDAAHAALGSYASVLEPEFFRRRAARLAAAQGNWRAQISKLEAEYSDALAQGRLTGPAAANATALLDQLVKLGPDNERLRWAHASLTSAWLARARAARAAGQLKDARKAVNAALAQTPAGRMADSLHAEYAAIERADKGGPGTPDPRLAASLRETLNDVLGQGSLTPQEASSALATLQELAALAPSDPLVGKAPGQLAAELIASANAKANSGDWHGAAETLSASFDLLPESASLLQALDHARAQLHELSGVARPGQVLERRKGFLDLIAHPAFDAAWDKQLHGQLQMLAAALPPGSEWLSDARGRVAKLYLQHARELIRSHGFTDAGAALVRGRAFADLPDFAVVAKELKGAETRSRTGRPR